MEKEVKVTGLYLSNRQENKTESLGYHFFLILVEKTSPVPLAVALTHDTAVCNQQTH